MNTSLFWALQATVVIMTLLGFFLVLNKRLKSHPYQLYAYEILACTFNYGFPLSHVLMSFEPIRDMAYYSSHWDMKVDYRRMFLIIQYMTFIQNMIAIYSWQIYVTLDMTLYIDLYLMTKNPFKPQKSRLKYYYLLILILLFCTTGFVINDSENLIFFVRL